MNDIKINNILRRYRPARQIFGGVFGKNELENIKVDKYPFSIISNESNFGSRGSHWICIYFNSSGDCDYFDSYGDSPIKEIDAFINKHMRGTKTINKKQFQQFGSDVCGQYCIYFTVKRCQGYSMEKCLSVFKSENKLKNDTFVLEYVHNKFNC